MTAILNKLVSACQTIEANAGSGGGGGSEPEYGYSTVILTTSSFAGRCIYIPFCSYSDDYAEAKIYIKVNNDYCPRYYIEASHYFHNIIGEQGGFKVFKNKDAPTDSTELTFWFVQCRHDAVDGNMMGIKVNGIDTITSETFTVYKISTSKGHLAAVGDKGIVELTRPEKQFVPVTPSA